MRREHLLCVIPARGGSRRIPRKNIREFRGKPIIAYSIEAAEETGLFDDIVVSTEDAEIAEIATAYGATRIHPRRALMAADDVGTQAVAADVLRWYMDEARRMPSLVCTLYATAPLVATTDILRGYGGAEYARLEYMKMREQRHWADFAGKSAEHCVECRECEAKCPNKLPIVDDLKRAHADLTAEGWGEKAKI